MREVAGIELLSARHTFQNGPVSRLGRLRLAVVIAQPTIIRIRAIEAQRDESVGPATDAQLTQHFMHPVVRVPPSSVRYGTYEWIGHGPEPRELTDPVSTPSAATPVGDHLPWVTLVCRRKCGRTRPQPTERGAIGERGADILELRGQRGPA